MFLISFSPPSVTYAYIVSDSEILFFTPVDIVTLYLVTSRSDIGKYASQKFGGSLFTLFRNLNLIDRG